MALKHFQKIFSTWQRYSFMGRSQAPRLSCHGYSTIASSDTVPSQALEYEKGQKLHGYTVEKVVPVPEFSLAAIKLKHDATGAEHLHIARDDSNNVFGVGFRTTPMDSTGVPHILEHTALCGSQKYPVRDPFFKMLTRSLSTFMNAFTASDWTMYPFSSQNAQDYENLMSVYLDAVFFPRLRELDFKQEGWRLENEDLNDPNSPITFKGVVFNEMKGVFSVSQHLFSQKNQSLLLPSHTYSVVSGGDPIHIPDLTWKQLQDFHTSHYHPSNSRFYTYGNLPLEGHLKFIEDNALSKFTRTEVNTKVPVEPRWQTPRSSEIQCNPDPMVPDPRKQTTMTVSYLLHDVTDTFEAFTLSILGALLTHGEKSPFYQALLEANIGSDFSPVTGYNGYTRESSFSVGLQGIQKEDVDRVASIIEETFEKIVEEGFEDERIEGILHMIELGQKHQTEKFGLHLGVGLMPSWIHDGDPIEAIQVTKHVTRFKECIDTIPNFLQDRVKHYFKDSKHKLTLVMSPDEQFELQRQLEEKKKLENMVSQLSDGQKQEIYNQGVELLKYQMTEEDLSSLPSLAVADIPPVAPSTDTTVHYANGIPIQLSSQPTNGVTYFRAISSMASLPDNVKPYTSLFCDVATKMGAGALDYKELAQQVELKTGGLDVNLWIQEHHTKDQVFEQGLEFHSMCLDANIEAMFGLWTEIFHRINLTDTQRLMTLIQMSASDYANSVADKGHSYAMGQAASSLSAAGALRELTGGMQQVSLMKTIAEMQDLQPIVDILRDIASHVLNRQNLRCCVNSMPETMDNAAKATEAFVCALPHHLHAKPEEIQPVEFYHKDAGFQGKSCSTHYELPFQVNYASRSVATVPYTHNHFATLRVLARLLTTRYLHREIREKGGAYGGGAASSPGSFSFYSYRDPNSMQTLETFDKAVAWAVEGSYTQQDIDEAKLSVFAQVDMPVPPGSRGLRLFKHDIDDATFQQHREALFAVSKDDLITVTEKYLSPGKGISSQALLGPENAATKDSDTWTVKKQA